MSAKYRVRKLISVAKTGNEFLVFFGGGEQFWLKELNTTKRQIVLMF